MVRIEMDGPAKNALGTEMMQWLRAELRKADGQPVLLTGAGDAFSAGLNLKEIVTLDKPGMEAFLGELEAMVYEWFHYPAPTAAAVNGHAIAGGCILQLICDIRVCTSNPRARLGLNEVALGLQFPPRTYSMAHYRLDPRHAETVLLGAALWGPEDALRLGLVDAISDDPVAEASKRLEAVAGHPPAAYRAAKAKLRGDFGHADAAKDKAFVEDVLPVWSSDELKKRIQALLGGRR